MKLNNEYKRQVYKMMDSAGIARSNASSFGNLTKFETWQRIEVHCRIKNEDWVVCPIPALIAEDSWTVKSEEVLETQEQPTSIQLFEPISKPAIKQFDVNEYFPETDYSLDDLLAELENKGQAPKLIKGQSETIDFAQFEGASSTPASISKQAENLGDEEEEVQRWYEKPVAIAGIIAALFFASMGLTIGYRAINGVPSRGEIGEVRAIN